jgi:hypothetical protein
MRTRTVATLALMLAMAGCGAKTTNDPQVASAQNSTAKASAAPSASASDDPDAALKFSQCMRDHGVTDFPDPVDGKLSFGVEKGTDMTKIDAAQEACKKFMPNGGEPKPLSAEDLEQARGLAKCMRENGVPNFPDPDPNGGLAIDGSKLGTGPGDPTFDKAEKACSQYVPEGARTEKHDDGKGTAVERVG